MNGLASLFRFMDLVCCLLCHPSSGSALNDSVAFCMHDVHNFKLFCMDLLIELMTDYLLYSLSIEMLHEI
uniref:Secreted protein n=1 Tax=Arundo donax TaxID=35708 RepID=A0A0A9HCZ9_ARUDO